MTRKIYDLANIRVLDKPDDRFSCPGKHILITICKLFQAEMSRKAVIRFEIERYLKVDRIKFKVIYFYRHISRIVSVEN